MRKNNLALWFFMVVFFTACQNNDQPSRTPKEYSSKQLRDNIIVGAVGFNDDETKVLTMSNASGIFNVYMQNFGDSISVPLTHSTTNSCFAVSFLPASNKFIYHHDEGGDENSHLYISAVGDTASTDITPWGKSQNNFFGWNEAKNAIYVMSNHRDPRYFDIWKLDTATWKPVLFFQNDSAWTPALISKSERYIALTKEISTDKNEMYLIDRSNITMKRISNDNEANWFPAAIEKSDSIFYYTTNDGSEFNYLVRYNISTGKGETYYKDNWDVMDMTLSENEKYHVILVNEDGKNKVTLFEHSTNKSLPFPGIKDVDIQRVIISPSEKNMVLEAGSSTSPDNIYAYNFDSKNLVQLTSSLNKEVDEKDLVKAEIVRFKSFDDKEIPAIYYKPQQATKNNKVGALVWVHGGPGGQSIASFNNSVQYLVNHGYAVLAVNNRGSSGYGKTFYKLDNRDHGYGDLKDCIWGKKWLASKDYIDSNAIGIYGGSYGGNMVLNALCLHPDEFEVGVDLFGVANWLRTLRSIPPYWEAFRKALYDEMGDPNTDDSLMLKATSPLYNYEKIKKPLIVFQGANDVRVLPIESDEIVAGVKKNGVPVEYVRYPEEGHGFTKKEDMITTDERTLAFLQKYLKPNKKKP